MLTATLALLNAVGCTIDIPRDGFVQAGLQYGAGGAGTVVLEGTLDGTTYQTIGLTPASNGAVVLLLAASGIGWADVSIYSKIQVRCSVAGAGVVATLNVQSV
jgi:hypothetical protein